MHLSGPVMMLWTSSKPDLSLPRAAGHGLQAERSSAAAGARQTACTEDPLKKRHTTPQYTPCSVQKLPAHQAACRVNALHLTVHRLCCLLSPPCPSLLATSEASQGQLTPADPPTATAEVGSCVQLLLRLAAA